MDIWKSKKWEGYYKNHPCRNGLRLRYDKNIYPDVKQAIKDFAIWLRCEYVFPIRVPIYVKASERIKTKDGDLVCGLFFRPFDRNTEPYIRISTGDYPKLLKSRGKYNALFNILWTIAHELSHYFQWVNNLELSLKGEERQATYFANRIIKKYAERDN